MNIYHYSFVLLIAILVILATIQKIRVSKNRNKMLSPNDIIVVEHKGTSLPMTAIQYKSWWSAMSDKDKDRHAKSVKTKVANGSLVSVKMGDSIVYVKEGSKAANSFEHVFVGKFSDRIKKRKKK
jgi:hypothetical protein